MTTPFIKESDQQVMARLRKPIDELIEKYCSDKTDYQKLRLRQLAWQAVDVLIRTRSISNLQNQKDIKRICLDIHELGASEVFIEESLALAVAIYRRMQIYHPLLLKTYGSR